MGIIESFVSTVNGFLWDFALLILLCGTGIYFTITLKFIQVRRFKQSFKAVFGSMKFKGSKSTGGGMSSFQSLATAVAAQVGTGNVAGAAAAIVSGGPGAIFWMWVSAFFGMATIFAEATLAQKYKKVVNGKVIGGPAYYITAVFKGKFGKILAGSFALFTILALGFMGNMVQSNSISASFKTAFGINPLSLGIVVALLAGFVFMGGVSRIASVTEKIVPVMAALYIIGSLVVIGMNFENIIPAFQSIFIAAFDPMAVTGGVVGISVREAVRFGVARGLFSNEAGMGSTPHAHALAKVKHPCDQGVVAIMGVFIDTFIVLNMTALVILTSYDSFSDILGSGITGVELAQGAFALTIGNAGNIFVAICMFFFAFSTIIGWYFFGEVNVKYLFGEKAVKVYALLVMVFIVIGSTLKVELVWSMADMFNGLMVIPNIIGILALSSIVRKTSKEYDNLGRNKK